jgi:hypothetical protein
MYKSQHQHPGNQQNTKTTFIHDRAKQYLFSAKLTEIGKWASILETMLKYTLDDGKYVEYNNKEVMLQQMRQREETSRED